MVAYGIIQKYWEGVVGRVKIGGVGLNKEGGFEKVERRATLWRD